MEIRVLLKVILNILSRVPVKSLFRFKWLSKTKPEGIHVPHDVISNHILPRLPAKSVCRFNCVSKEWHSFLTSDNFKNKHNDHIDNHENNLKHLVLSKSEGSFWFTTIDCEAPPRREGLTLTRHPLPQFGDTTRHDIHILTSFHGLVCLGIIKDMYDDRYSDLILWNPLTNEHKRLSKSNSHKHYNKIRYTELGLYYSCCEDDYKILLVERLDHNVYIYSLKSDSWRKVDGDIFPRGYTHYFGGLMSRGMYSNVNLYFLKSNNYGHLNSIIRFDTKTERFSKIETGNVNNCIGRIGSDYNARDYHATIMVISDCIHVCVKYDVYSNGKFFPSSTCIKLWKLDENENLKEVVTYQLMPQLEGISTSSVAPFHLMKNGNWLMRNCDFRDYKIYEVDLEKKKHYYFGGKGKGIICAKVRMDGYIGYWQNAEIRYIETFVSPNRYMK